MSNEQTQPIGSEDWACPNCGYDVSAQIPTNDVGEMTCPECGAAFDMEALCGSGQMYRLPLGFGTVCVLLLPAMIFAGAALLAPMITNRSDAALEALLLAIVATPVYLYLMNRRRAGILPKTRRFHTTIFQTVLWSIANVTVMYVFVAGTSLLR